MRPFVIVATCLACAHAPARTTQFTPDCPSPEAIEAARISGPPRQAGKAEPPPPSGQVHVDIHEGPSRLRYATYVIDSKYVGLVDQWAPNSTNSPLRNLRATDIVSIEVLKEKSAAEHWRACPGVPVVLILTKSKG